MNANELRIGNIVNYIGAIQNVTSEIIRECELNNATTQPILLTEEWLLKFGFVKYDDGCELKGNDCFYGINKTGIIIGLTPRFSLSGYIPAKKIEYVHQLENLYFSLTGEELTIKN